MEATDRVRQANTAVSAGQNYPRESKHEFHLRARSRFADAARSWSTRPDRCAAASGQDHFAEGNCKGDSGKLSRHCSYPAAGGRAAGRGDVSTARNRWLEPDARYINYLSTDN